MVGFGKSIVKAQREGWVSAYLDYELLKDVVGEIEHLLAERNSLTFDDAFAPKDNSGEGIPEEGMPTDSNVQDLQESFFKALQMEVEKLSLFILQQQGRLADAVGVLRFSSPLFDEKNTLLFSGSNDNYQRAVDNNNVLNQYTHLGVELLHLLKFVSVNSIAVRKILKKYNKCFEKLDEPHKYEVCGDHLQQLAYSPSIRAIESSLQSALSKSLAYLPTYATTGDQTVALLRIKRFQCVMSCNERLRRNAEILQQPFWDFLSRKSMILTGTNLGGMEGNGKKALEWLMQLRPERLLTMADEQLNRLWVRWSSGPAVASIQDKDWSLAEEEFCQEEVTLSIVRNPNLNRGWIWGGVNSTSMTLNLLSTLLYTINYYIVAPTANHYAIQLGENGAYGSTLIGASSFSALFAAFFYSFWYTRSSFKSALLFSALCPVIGNLTYALAISYDSMRMAIFGRILCGFGSAEVVNRQLISACVSFEGMTKASALFVAAGAIGMSIGPLLAGILDMVTGRDVDVDISLPFAPAGGLVYNNVTSPGFIMAGLWLVESIALAFFFQEPDRINGVLDNMIYDGERTEDADSGDDTSDDGMPLLVSNEGYGSIAAGAKSSKSSTLLEDIKITAKLIVQNPALPVTVLLFGYIEMVDEVLISSCSMVVRRYFGWHGSVAGFLIASLGALVIPAHFVVEKASHYYSERSIMSKSLVFLVISLLGILSWSGLLCDVAGELVEVDYLKTDGYCKMTDEGEFQYDFGSGPVVYIVFLSAVFMGTIVLEGVDSSIMAKITPGALNNRFVNCGLLATLVGTLGRVIADGMITVSALMDIHVLVDFVNVTFFPMLIATLLGLCMCRNYYKHLF